MIPFEWSSFALGGIAGATAVGALTLRKLLHLTEGYRLLGNIVTGIVRTPLPPIGDWLERVETAG